MLFEVTFFDASMPPFFQPSIKSVSNSLKEKKKQPINNLQQK